jgi:hypothetical protein
MGLVNQFDKRTGITYVYESTSHWDKEKQQSRSTRKIVGRLDPETGEIVPTGGNVPAELSGGRLYVGATWLLEQISEKTGVARDLRSAFGDDRANAVLSLAMFLCCEDTPEYRFKPWASRHRHPFGKDIPSQRASELFASLTDDECADFFKSRASRRSEGEYWAYDTTSISSLSELIEPVERGYNKEGDDFGQFNLLLLFGEDSNLPFYYRIVRGNVPDVSTVRTMLGEAGLLDLRKVKYCMDRGFSGKANLDAFYSSHSKFLVGGRTSHKVVRDRLTDEVRKSIETESKLIIGHDVYATAALTKWEIAQPDGEVKSHRLYVHLYYDPARATQSSLALDRRLAETRAELEAGGDAATKKQFLKYFAVRRGRGISVKLDEERVLAAKRDFGWFSLLTNDISDAGEALDVYRNRDVVEKAFGDLKGRLNFRRARVHSRRVLDGKLFVEFVALILMSYVKKRMQEKNLFAKYTLAELLDELEVIEAFRKKNAKKYVLGEITREQLSIYEAMDVPSPTSLR